MRLYYPEETAVLRPEMMVDWKRTRGAYNFLLLPKTAIICVDKVAMNGVATFGTKKLKGLKGHHFIKKELLFCAGFDNGASGIINLLEELRALGVQQFVFIGTAGILNSNIIEGDAYVVQKTISATGCTDYYYPEKEIGVFDAVFFERVKNGLNVKNSVCFSVDTPFRETRSLLDDAQKKGAEMIDMECAVVYAFSHFYKLSAACLLVAADNLLGEWTPPKNWHNLISKQKELIIQLIKILR